MSYTVDTNIMVYAVDENSPHHVKARGFVESRLNLSETWFLAWPTVYEYLRVVTHLRVFRKPLTPDEGEVNVRLLLESDQVEIMEESEDTWNAYRELASRWRPKGNFVHDMHIAALMLTNGVKKIYTCDIEFQKIRELKALDPLS